MERMGQTLHYQGNKLADPRDPKDRDFTIKKKMKQNDR
jgi:hypothetical protein